MSQDMAATPALPIAKTDMNGADSAPLSNPAAESAEQKNETDMSNGAALSSDAAKSATDEDTTRPRRPPPAVPPRIGSAIRTSAPEPEPTSPTPPVLSFVTAPQVASKVSTRNSTGSVTQPKFVSYNQRPISSPANSDGDKRTPKFVPYNHNDCMPIVNSERTSKFVPYKRQDNVPKFVPVKHSPVLSPKFLPSPVLKQKFSPAPVPPPKILPSPVLTPKFVPYTQKPITGSSSSFPFIDDDASSDSADAKSKSGGISPVTCESKPVNKNESENNNDKENRNYENIDTVKAERASDRQSFGKTEQWSPEINLVPAAPVCEELFSPKAISSPMVVDNAFRTAPPVTTCFNYENVDIQSMTDRRQSEFVKPANTTVSENINASRPNTVANMDVSPIFATSIDSDVSSMEMHSPANSSMLDEPDVYASRSARDKYYDSLIADNESHTKETEIEISTVTSKNKPSTSATAPPLLRPAERQSYENVTVTPLLRPAERQSYENVTVAPQVKNTVTCVNITQKTFEENESDKLTTKDTTPSLLQSVPQRQSYENVTCLPLRINTNNNEPESPQKSVSPDIAPPVLAPHRKQDIAAPENVSVTDSRRRVIMGKKQAQAQARNEAIEAHPSDLTRMKSSSGHLPPPLHEPIRSQPQKRAHTTSLEDRLAAENVYSTRPSNTGRVVRNNDSLNDRHKSTDFPLQSPPILSPPYKKSQTQGPSVNGLALKSPSNSRRRFVVESELPPSRTSKLPAGYAGAQQRSITPPGNDSESEDSYMSNSDFDEDDMSSFSDGDFTGCLISSPIETRTSQAFSPGRDLLYDTVVELLHTERAYVDRLHFLCRVVLLNLKVLDKVQDVHSLDETTIEELFVNVEVIFNFHACNLLPRIEERVRLWHQNQGIGDILKELVPFLGIYSNFVEHFHKCMKLMDWHRHNHSVYAALIEEVEKLPECRRLSVQQHMLHIAHRVAKYQAFLKDYYDNLSDNSPDKNDVKEALESVTKTAYKLERCMGKEERMNALKKMQRSLDTTTNFISASRELMKFGKIKIIAPKSGRRRERYAFLLNDMLLLCVHSGSGHKHKLRYILEVDGMQIYEGDNLQTPNTFYIHSKRKTVELHCSTLIEMREWKKAIRDVIDEFTKHKLSDALTVNYELAADQVGVNRPKTRPPVANSCFLCDCAFKMTRRKHRCRACAQFVCSTCYTQKAPLEFDNLQLHKVCDECYVIIRQRELKLGSETWEVDTITASNPGILSGTLQMSADMGKSWSKRWFVIHGNGILYSFKTNQDHEPYTTLPIKRFSVTTTQKDDSFHKNNAFKLYNVKRTYYFQAVDSGVTLSWLKVLADFSCSHA